MKIKILTTSKTRKLKNYTDIKPNLDIKSINGKPFKASYEYLPNGMCEATIEFEVV